MDARFEIETFNQYGLKETKYTICPICSPERSPKNQKLKCLKCDWQKGLGHCYHCGNLVQLHTYKGKSEKKRPVYHLPVSKPKIRKEGTFHSLEFLDEMIFKTDEKDNFSKYLEGFFDEDRIFNAINKLFIFNTNDYYKNSICYPYISPDEKITAIKVMAYDSIGKRIRNNEGRAMINWMHSLLKIEDWVNDICLFGLHQIKERKEKAVHIVESEKTAYVMTIVKPDFIWLASGGLTMINKEKLKPLKYHKIVLHPDKGKAFEQWNQYANEWKEYDIKVSRITEDNPEIPDKGDLADYYLQDKFLIKNLKTTDKKQNNENRQQI